MKTYKRVDRVRQLLQQEISRILQLEVKDPRVKFVTVTNVKLTADLRDAKVFVSSLDNTVEREELAFGLKRATGFIRGELGRQLKLKYIPQIEFVFDELYDKQERIMQLIDQIHSENQSEDHSGTE